MGLEYRSKFRKGWMNLGGIYMVVGDYQFGGCVFGGRGDEYYLGFF